MSRFIVNPNLPSSDVRSLICGGLNEALTDYLKSRGIEIFFTDKNNKVDEAVSRHCDIETLYLGSGKIIVNNSQRALISELKERGLQIICSEKEVEGAYPGDIILNNAVQGKYIIGNSKFFDPKLKENIGDRIVLSVNQGYAKCSVLSVDEAALITDDESIYRICLKNDLDCLLIRKGDVFLDGHEYGFIGGAGGKISDKEIMFFGDITKHKDYSEIYAFLSKRNIDIIAFDFPLTDFGGIVPLEEF